VRTAYYNVDVSSLPSLRAGFAAFTAEFNGALDICVPCAGINRNIPFLEMEEEEFDALCAVNFKGVYYTAQLAAKQMVANGTKCGSIIPVASIAGYRSIRGQMSTAYCATKGAVRAMVPPIAVELAKYVGFLEGPI
jgi:NAD(P)-dependent dehydrogenase (short-subunit alcohol dehydrogenase family)